MLVFIVFVVLAPHHMLIGVRLLCVPHSQLTSSISLKFHKLSLPLTLAVARSSSIPFSIAVALSFRIPFPINCINLARPTLFRIVKHLVLSNPATLATSRIVLHITHRIVCIASSASHRPLRIVRITSSTSFSHCYFPHPLYYCTVLSLYSRPQ
ncbi:hypothetical protein C8R47DRAFT_1209229 [Mycena vitilis]|nr:hypothetical protein C8R47DRAFT_1209229 [Mycena vitilis]